MVATVLIPATPRFTLGQIVITANAHAILSETSVKDAFNRHTVGDWGELCPEDARSNARALRHGGRLMSVFSQGSTRFWVITEADRSVTTLLLPQDY